MTPVDVQQLRRVALEEFADIVVEARIVAVAIRRPAGVELERKLLRPVSAAPSVACYPITSSTASARSGNAPGVRRSPRRNAWL